VSVPGEPGGAKGGDEPMTAIVARWMPLALHSTLAKDILPCTRKYSATAVAADAGSTTTNPNT
jgi:hypothetical protein